MKTVWAQDFTEAYFLLNTAFLTTQDVEYQVGPMSMIEHVHLTCPSADVSGLEMHKVGYTKAKWAHLYRSYLGPEKVEELKSLGLEVKGLSCGFDFRRKEEGNGACIREMLLSRRKRNGPWTSLTVIWRTSEITRKFLVDLILLNRIAALIPNTDFKEFHFYFGSVYQSSKIVVPFVESHLKLTFEQLNPSHPHAREVLRSKATYYDPDEPPHKLKADVARMRDIYKGRRFPPVDPGELRL